MNPISLQRPLPLGQALVALLLAAGASLALGLALGGRRDRESPPVSQGHRGGAAAASLGALAPAESPRGPLRLPGGGREVQTVKVVRARLARDIEAVGSVSYDQDHFTLIGPLISGRVAALRAGIGDRVRAGQVLAELESAEVGQAQAAYLIARAANEAAQANLRRERELAERNVSSAREHELAQAQAATEEANLAAARQRLRALGLRAQDIASLSERSAGHTPLISPIDGTILTRQVTLGQAVQPATDAFTVADLLHLWVLLDLFEKDLPYVHVGQRAELRTEVYPGRTFPARVAYVGQVIDERTRTAPVRIEFRNEEGLFRPGQFVTATLHGDPSRASAAVLAVPRRAVLSVEGKPVVFVSEGGGATFTRRLVEPGAGGTADNGTVMVELRSGVREGEHVAVDGAFLLKSELLR